MYSVADGPFEYTNLTVTTTATELKVGATALDERKILVIQALGARIFIGFDNLVTTNNGLQIAKKQTIFLEVGPKVSVYAIVNSGTSDVRIAELA